MSALPEARERAAPRSVSELRSRFRQGKAELLWYSQSAFRLTTVNGKVILIDPWIMGATKIPPELESVPRSEIGAAVAKAHRGIVDAIAAGDRGLARHRMLRHLQALTREQARQ